MDKIHGLFVEKTVSSQQKGVAGVFWRAYARQKTPQRKLLKDTKILYSCPGLLCSFNGHVDTIRISNHKPAFTDFNCNAGFIEVALNYF